MTTGEGYVKLFARADMFAHFLFQTTQKKVFNFLGIYF